jgi:hypothetical protein
MKERDGGYYWVKLPHRTWIIAYYDILGHWLVPGSDVKYFDGNFDFIEETLITRIE